MLILDKGNHTIARIGGDEFAVLLRSDQTDVVDIIDRVLKQLQLPIQVNEITVNISASIGVAILGEDADNSSDLMRYADMALYKSKESGRNTFHYYSEQLETKIINKNKLLKDLESAIKNNQLALHYQPQHDLASNTITGVEALVRWPLPNGEFIYPDQFIPLAEDSGLIIPLGEWILKQATHDGKILNNLAGPLSIAVNLSTRQFKQPDLVEKIIQYCELCQLPHDLLELEITESLLLDNMAQALNTLQSLRKQGFKISLDDFGTGYSSMFYLKNLPVSGIKIDRSFTAGIPADHKDMVIVDSTIELAHKLDLTVTAEGIETRQQVDHLRQAGCDSAQGYLLSRPQPLAEIIAQIDAATPSQSTLDLIDGTV